MKKTAFKKYLLSTIMISGNILFSMPSANATVANGVYAYEKGNYQLARQEWLPYAALGNSNALYNLGQLYRMGRGVERDFAKAEEYYLRAAEKGHLGAQRNLGTLYYFGRVGQKNNQKAFQWLSRAAANGDPRSQQMIGTMYYNGEGVEKNIIRSYAWIRLAAMAGIRTAKDTMEKLQTAMTQEQIEQATQLAPQLITHKISPDDIGLMVNQKDSNATSLPELDTSKTATMPAKTATMPAKTAMTQRTPAEVSPGNITVADNFRIQLGSFRTQQSAGKTLGSLMSKYPAIIDNKQGRVEHADLGEKGIYYRVQLYPFETRDDAAYVCSQFKENGQGCYVIKAP